MKPKPTAALNLATYAASTAMLKPYPGIEGMVYAYACTDLQKATMPLAAMVGITMLLTTQRAGLAFLAIYALWHPSWKESLDALAMLRLEVKIGSHVPAVCALEARRVELLDERKGWVGDADVEGGKGKILCRKLVLGWKEKVRSGVMYRMVSLIKDRGM